MRVQSTAQRVIAVATVSGAMTAAHVSIAVAAYADITHTLRHGAGQVIAGGIDYVGPCRITLNGPSRIAFCDPPSVVYWACLRLVVVRL